MNSTGPLMDGRGSESGRALIESYGLTCNHLSMPLGIGHESVAFGWHLRSAANSQKQSAFRILVARRTEDLGRPERVDWDSGQIASDRCWEVKYEGPALESSTRYFWRLLVWDTQMNVTDPRDSWFETGLLRADEWCAQWIGLSPFDVPVASPPQTHDVPRRQASLPPPPYLRREFELSAPPSLARLYVTARGAYEMHLNGESVGDAELTPEWTDYRYRIHYQTYDVTPLLRSGTNAIGAILADGWWAGSIGFDGGNQRKHYGTAPQLLAQLLLKFKDGTSQTIVTDAQWRASRGAIRFADMLLGEYVDARDEPRGWDTAGFDDTSWGFASVLGDDTSTVTASTDNPVRVTRELPVQLMRELTPGRWMADLGQNIAGRIRLTIRNGARGDRIVVRHAEMLDGDKLYSDNLRSADATDYYIKSSGAVETFEPRFTYHGFRYVEVSGYTGELKKSDLVGRVLHNDVEWTGNFECSDPSINQLYSNICWSQRGNLVSIPTDCPQRDERLGWLGDAQIFLPTACKNADVFALYRRWLEDINSDQTEDGAFPDVAPQVVVLTEGAPAFGDGGVLIPWTLYRHFGDIAVLSQCYPHMRAWVDHVHRHNSQLIWRHRAGRMYGDWLQTGVETPRELVATAYFARSTQILSLVAAKLGDDAESRRYYELSRTIAAAFVAEFFDNDGTARCGTQTAYLLALAFDLLPDALVGEAVTRLVEDIRQHENHLTTGFVGTPLICPVLSEHGYPEVAYDLLFQRTYPSWLYSIGRGATTMWERWDGWTDEGGFQTAEMNSFNHYALGSIGNWLFETVAGLSQSDDSVGYDRLCFRPVPSKRLSYARATIQTRRGLAKSGWQAKDGGIEVDVTVPPGASADLIIPTSDPSTIHEVTGCVSEVRPASWRIAAQSVTVGIPSGRHMFRWR
jgi:alpha-L-rhamnosidase